MNEVNPLCEDMCISVPLNKFPLPNDSTLKLVYDVYKSSNQTKCLKSERGRVILPEELMDNSNVKTLKELSVQALSRITSVHPLPMIQNNKDLLKIHYETLDVNMPLKECYLIDDENYWRRVVLTKKNRPELMLKNDYDWKSNGISIKFVEILESGFVEQWSEEEMTELALKIQDFVKVLHIKRLQSLEDNSFLKYFDLDRSSTTSDGEENLDSDQFECSIETLQTEEDEEVTYSGEQEVEDSSSDRILELSLIEEKAQSKEERRQLREICENEREMRRRRRERRELKRLKHLALEEAKSAKPIKKTKKKIKQPKSFFDIQISESEDDNEVKIYDHRNKELVLRRIKAYKYPFNDCHHINLNILHYFRNLDTLCIEFLGPIVQEHYHCRHLNFSYNDIINLANGLRNLPVLRVFRLRNSRMDSTKLDILIDVLKTLPSLKVLDFGNNTLKDDCISQWKNLFLTTKTVCHLELESNLFDIHTMTALSTALKNYKNGTLDYLGLARNPISDSALHILISQILGTNHIKCLNLNSLFNVTEDGIICCIVNELIRHHSALVHLDMTAVYISNYAADEIIKALNGNTKLLVFNTQGCGLDDETDLDIKVLMRRNKYIFNNPFVGNMALTNDEIDAGRNRTSHPIMLAIFEELKNQAECLEKRKNINAHDSVYNLSENMQRVRTTLLSGADTQRTTASNMSIVSYPLPICSSHKPDNSYTLKANNFNEEEYLEHLRKTNCDNRYYYFKSICNEELLEY